PAVRRAGAGVEVPPAQLDDPPAGGPPLSANGANAPADNPEDAETLPARGLRPDLVRRGDEATAGEAAAVRAVASAPGEGTRGTPGMSQPGSAMVASLRQD